MRSIFAAGHFLEPSDNPSREYVIGGRCDLKGAVSPNSGKPLLQLASLNVATGNLKLEQWPSPYVKLLYSWTCAICEGRFTYRHSESSLEILEAKRGGAYDDFPYPYYPEAFREVPVELLPISADEQAKIAAINTTKGDIQFELIESSPELAIPRHQVGGEPYFVSREPKATHCPLCHEEMAFLATIGNKTFYDSLGFTGNEFVQVIYRVCQKCNILTAKNYAD